MPESKRVRQSDIAEHLGLTKVSVSKALRDHPDISEKTRQRVKEVARKMGYVPNRVARSLTSSQSKTLGVVVPKVAHSFFAEVLDGIHEESAKRGYEIVLTVSQESADTERKHLETLLAMRVDGLLVSVSKEEPHREVYERAREMGVPLVFFDRALEGLGFSSVTVDDREGAREAVDHVIEQGRKRVAHVAGYAHTNIGCERRAGYEQALQGHELPLREEWIVEGGFDEESGYAGAAQILERTDHLPEAIFAVTFPVGLGVLDALRQNHPNLENQVQIVVFGNQRLNRYLRPSFICVAQPARTLGERATGLLFEQMENQRNGKSHPEQVVLPTHLAGVDSVMHFDGTPAVARSA